MSTKTKSPPVEIFEQAMKNYEQALQAGLKLQEETAQWWTSTLHRATTLEELQRHVQNLTKDVIPETQKRMKASMKLIEQNSETSLELLKQAVDAALTPPTDAPAKAWMDFWESSLRTIRKNAQAVTDLNNQVVDDWLTFAGKVGAASTSEPKAKA